MRQVGCAFGIISNPVSGPTPKEEVIPKLETAGPDFKVEMGKV
jgi:hypothetical protein